jgi:hypothetical protein
MFELFSVFPRVQISVCKQRIWCPGACRYVALGLVRTSYPRRHITCGHTSYGLMAGTIFYYLKKDATLHVRKEKKSIASVQPGQYYHTFCLSCPWKIEKLVLFCSVVRVHMSSPVEERAENTHSGRGHDEFEV